MQLEGYTLESPNLKSSSHAQFFGILKKLTILQVELFLHFFTMQGHTFIKINKQLKSNGLQYTILCLQSVLSIYLNINTNIQIST